MHQKLQCYFFKSLGSKVNFSIIAALTCFMSGCNGFISVLVSLATTADEISSNSDELAYTHCVPIFDNSSGPG